MNVNFPDGSGQNTTSLQSMSSSQTVSLTTSSSQPAANTPLMTPTPTASPSHSTMAALSSSVSVKSSTSVVPTKAALTKSCVSVSFVLNFPWNDSYASNNSREFKLLKFGMAIVMSQRYNDTNKYGDVRVTDLSLREKTRRVMLSFRLCMVLKKAGSEFIEDIFMKEVKTGKYFAGLQIIEGSVEFKAFGVKLTNWKAKDGECAKCSQGGGGPFVIEADKCEPKAGYSCNGVKKMEKSSDCVKYCDSNVAAVTLSSSGFTLGILFSFSFNMWN